jgi:hypothetical protein
MSLRLDQYTLRIPAGTSPLEEDFVTSFEELVGLASAGRSTLPIIMIAEGSLNDIPTPDLVAQSRLNLFDEIASRLQRISQLVGKLSAVNRPSVWISAGDCTGIWWEIAQSFRSRLWFGDYCQVGFPETARGEMSPLGILIKLIYKTPSLIDQIVADPVIHSRSAFELGWIDAVFPKSGHQDVAQLVELLSSPPFHQVRDDVSSSQSIAQRRTLMKWREPMGSRREDRIEDFKSPGSLKVFRELLKSKESIGIQQSVESILIPSRVRELIERPLNALDSDAESRPIRSQKTIQLRASGVLPPTAALVRIIRNDGRIALFDSNPTAILRASEVIDARFRKFFSEDEAKSIRQNQMLFFHSARSVRIGHRLLELDFGLDERVSMRIGSLQWSGYLLEGNDPSHLTCPLEVCMNQIDESIDPNSLLFAFETVIPTDWLYEGAMPLSFAIRSICLDRLFNFTQKLQLSFVHMIPILKSMGWRFLGDEARITRFLRLQTDMLSSFGMGQDLFGRNYADYSLKDLQESIYRRIQSTGERAEHGIEVNLAAKVIVSSIFVMLSESRPSIDQSKIDKLIASSTGFPMAMGSIRDFIDNFGLKRIFSYAKHLLDAKMIERAFHAYAVNGRRSP